MPRRRPPIMAASRGATGYVASAMRASSTAPIGFSVLRRSPLMRWWRSLMASARTSANTSCQSEVRQRAAADPLVAGDRPRHDGGTPRPVDRRGRPSCPRGRGARPGPSRRDRWRRDPSRARPAPAAPRRTPGCPGARRPRARPAPSRAAPAPRTRPALRPARAADRPPTTSRRRPSSAPARRASWCPPAPRPGRRRASPRRGRRPTVSSRPVVHASLERRVSAGDVVVEGGRRSGDVPAHQRHGEEGRADPSRIVHHHRGRRRRDAGRGQRVLHHGLRRELVAGEGRLERREPHDHPRALRPEIDQHGLVGLAAVGMGDRRDGRRGLGFAGDRGHLVGPGRDPAPESLAPVRRRHAGPPSPCAEAR